GGPFLLASVASLEKRGEGVTAAVSRQRIGVLAERVSPSPFASKLASSLRGEALPHQGGGGRVSEFQRLMFISCGPAPSPSSAASAWRNRPPFRRGCRSGRRGG